MSISDSIKEFFSGNIIKKSILVLILVFSVISSIFATMCNDKCDDSKERSKGLLHASYIWIILCVPLAIVLFIKRDDMDGDTGIFKILLVISICIGILSSSFSLECSVGCKDPEHKNNPKTNEAAYGIAGFTLAFSIVFGLLVCWATMT